jgi:C_GCAxxG_C_C family probable redox protein
MTAEGKAIEKKQQAIHCFQNDSNCSQAVFSTFAPEFGIDMDTALKLASGFGGGMGRLQDTCGAVSGALMVLGLKYGKGEKDDEIAREREYRLVRRFTEAFEKQNGSIYCRDLIPCDLNNETEVKKAKADGVFERICEKCIGDSVVLVEQFLRDPGEF